MLTPFGIETRKLRLDKGLRLFDLAEALGVTSAFVSAVETGKRPIPENYVSDVTRAMRLTKDEAERLQKAADRTRMQVSVAHLSGDARELVAAVSRMLPSKLAVLRRQLLKSIEDMAFRRDRNGVVVAPKSQSAIAKISDDLRSLLIAEDHVKFPIIEVLEFAMPEMFEGFTLEIGDYSTMGQDEGQTIAGLNCIILRQDVYDGACKDTTRDRFTACHELGHFIMHQNIVLARTRRDDEKVYLDSEWQADVFAGSLLMSARHLRLFSDVSDAASQCGMSITAANVMWSKYRATPSLADAHQGRLF